MKEKEYVHGYSESESQRLSDQASTLNNLLHHDSIFCPSGLVLEAGCGTGAQTVIVAPQNPACNFMSVDISEESLTHARQRIDRENISNVSFNRLHIQSSL
jgi:tRNA G46 methylase TrmB